MFSILIAVVTRRPVEGEEVIVDLDSVKQSSKQMAANDSDNDFTGIGYLYQSWGIIHIARIYSFNKYKKLKTKYTTLSGQFLNRIEISQNQMQNRYT